MEQECYKRRYSDLDNSSRVLKIMYFQSRNDSRHISEFKQSLIATDMEDENPTKRTYIVKGNLNIAKLIKKDIHFQIKK